MENAQSDTFKIFLCSIHYFIHVGKMLAKLSKCREDVGKMKAKCMQNVRKIQAKYCWQYVGKLGRMLVKCRENVEKLYCFLSKKISEKLLKFFLNVDCSLIARLEVYICSTNFLYCTNFLILENREDDASQSHF